MEVRSRLHSLSRLHARRHVAVPGLRNRSILSSFFLRSVSSLTAGFRADCHANAPLSDGVTKSPRVAFYSTVSSGRFLFTGSSVRFSSLFWSEVDCRFFFFHFDFPNEGKWLDTRRDQFWTFLNKMNHVAKSVSDRPTTSWKYKT